eukprot:CAMPEP_0182462338 /NCGR_PEP_ID=MMETSP1319-20130603/6635_1 /TAXON_ID=172717 /ORGANISM="Bolidomonas pacifica, Strain RCC208" /LENGTH=529 /DNA_ID=CAMNT_0024661761 /DNA_START=290 /DNA_END=1880 /DNA_ORIENTATION=+
MTMSKLTSKLVNDIDIDIDDIDIDIDIDNPNPSPTVDLLGPINTPTVWSYFNNLTTTDTANLGQGFPDTPPPKFLTDSLKETIDSGYAIHQYTNPNGHPPLVKELMKRYSLHLHQPLTPSNVAITVGASQALYLSLRTIVTPGSEVIIFEPFFDLYVNQVKLCGGKPRFVPLKLEGGRWNVDEDELAAALSPKTSCLILNSPHNPTGKVFTYSEQLAISLAILPYPSVKVLSDEVYKYIIHSPPPLPPSAPSTTVPGHTHFASLPGMYPRTITISSCGKTFSATGWQVGWAVGPSSLIGPVQQVLPQVQFCACSLAQDALARALPQADGPYEDEDGEVWDDYYVYLRERYRSKRDLLAKALEEAGFDVPDYGGGGGGGGLGRRRRWRRRLGRRCVGGGVVARGLWRPAAVLPLLPHYRLPDLGGQLSVHLGGGCGRGGGGRVAAVLGHGQLHAKAADTPTAFPEDRVPGAQGLRPLRRGRQVPLVGGGEGLPEPVASVRWLRGGGVHGEAGAGAEGRGGGSGGLGMARY